MEEPRIQRLPDLPQVIGQPHARCIFILSLNAERRPIITERDTGRNTARSFRLNQADFDRIESATEQDRYRVAKEVFIERRKARNERAARQAEALAAHVRRGGSAARWWASKDFGSRDQAAILAALRRLQAVRPADAAMIGQGGGRP